VQCDAATVPYKPDRPAQKFLKKKGSGRKKRVNSERNKIAAFRCAKTAKRGEQVLRGRKKGCLEKENLGRKGEKKELKATH